MQLKYAMISLDILISTRVFCFLKSCEYTFANTFVEWGLLQLLIKCLAFSLFLLDILGYTLNIPEF